MHFFALFIVLLQIANTATFHRGRPVRHGNGVTMRRPRFPVRFFPLIGRFFRNRRVRPTNRPQTHFHVSLNGRQFEHFHAFGDVGHTHDTTFPPGINSENGVGWNIPPQWRDTDSWSLFDRVNPDSVLVWNTDLPENKPETIPDSSLPNRPLFPDSVLPSDVEVPVITSEFLPTSDKRKEPAITRPLLPVSTGKGDFLSPGIIVNVTNSNSTDLNGTQENTGNDTTTSGINKNFVPVSMTTAETPRTVDKKTKEPSCHKTGCMTGHECVYSGSYICPIYIPEVDCKCRAGCRMDYTFIPFGATVTMDTCGNSCSCFNMFGAPTCSNKPCVEDPQKQVPGKVLIPEVSSVSTRQSPLPTQISFDITTTDQLEINQPKDNIQMNFPVIPIVKDNQKS